MAEEAARSNGGDAERTGAPAAGPTEGDATQSPSAGAAAPGGPSTQPPPPTGSVRTAWEDAKHAYLDHGTFKVNGESPMGPKIERILGRSENYLIWINEGRLAFHFNDPLPPHMRPALREFRRLATTVRIVLAGEQRTAATELLAAGLNYAFNTPAGEDAAVGLAPARSFIEIKSIERARSNFLAITTVASILAFVALYWAKYHAAFLHPYLKEIALGGMAGIVGAAISLIQRGTELQVDPFSSRIHKAFHGVLRALLGMIFGMIVVIAARSNLAFGIATQNVYALFILALVGGFSERLVPDMMTRLSQDQADTSNAGPTHQAGDSSGAHS